MTNFVFNSFKPTMHTIHVHRVLKFDLKRPWENLSFRTYFIPMPLPDPKVCLFYANAKAGYVIQHLVGAIAQIKRSNNIIRMNISPEGIHIQTDIPFIDRSKSTKKLVMDKPSDVALLNTFLLGNRFDRFECKRDITVEINPKNLNDQVRSLKRKERVILYILDKRPTKDHSHELCIFTETTVEKEQPHETTSAFIKVMVTQGLTNARSTDELEFVSQEEGQEPQPVYIHKFTVPPSSYDRVKKFGTRGQSMTIRIQGSDYIYFAITNKQMYGKELSIGTFNPKEKYYEGVFDMEYFAAIGHLSKIKKDLMFYPPEIEGHPIKIEIALDTLGDSIMYIKDNKRIQSEFDFSDSKA